MRMEILQRLRGGHALSKGQRSARALANHNTTDWGSLVSRKLEHSMKLAHKCMSQYGWPGSLVRFARYCSAKIGRNLLAS